MLKKIFVLLLLPLTSFAKADDNIRVAIAHSVTLAEVKKRPAIITPDNYVSFRDHNYLGRLEFYEDGKGTMTVVNVLPLEDYLVGLVASEISREWPIEAIKAQAVAARAYALYQKNARSKEWSQAYYDLESTVLDQVYEGEGGANSRVKQAVQETRGEIITSHGKLVKTFFHSSCGSQTEAASNVWGEEDKFHTVLDPYCVRSPYNSWTFKIAKAELAKKIRLAGFPAETIDDIQVETKRGNPRAATVIIDTGNQTVYLQGQDLRKIIGYENLKSTWFDVKTGRGEIVFTGRGYGHGVGMCQWGSKGMADSGKTYREILKFYYPGTKIETF